MIKLINLKNNENKFIRNLYIWPRIYHQNLYCSVNKNVKFFDNIKINKNRIIKIGNNENIKTKIYSFKNYNFDKKNNIDKTTNITKHNRISIRCFSTNSGNNTIDKNNKGANINKNEGENNIANNCKQTILEKSENKKCENNEKQRQKT